jgi:hypothetical protein
VATVRFVAFALADLDALRALLRLAEFPLRNFARFCTFDPFLRLAMIDPLVRLVEVKGYPQEMAEKTTN